MQPTTPPPHPSGRRIRRVRGLRWAALVAAALLVLPVVSYVRALTYPGNATFVVRSVEWVRDHGGGGLVDTVENLVYSRNAPPTTGAPQDVTAGPASPARPVAADTALPTVTLLRGVAPIAGEGRWSAVAQGLGQTRLWTTWFRPDRAHQPVTVAAALMPRSAVAVRLSPGTREPVVGLASPSGYRVPTQARRGLVAAFNSGFKMQDSRGGWWTRTSPAIPLVAGRASAVLYRDGSVRVGAWGRGVRATPGVVAVRQNLDMIVSGGQVVDGLTSNARGRWGSSKSQYQYTWRSGLGTDQAGNLVYVAGRGLTLATLATAMQRAGIREGMQLDIHPAMVSFNIERPRPDGSVGSRALLASMRSAPQRYLTDDQRDFFYVVAR